MISLVPLYGSLAFPTSSQIFLTYVPLSAQSPRVYLFSPVLEFNHGTQKILFRTIFLALVLFPKFSQIFLHNLCDTSHPLSIPTSATHTCHLTPGLFN